MELLELWMTKVNLQKQVEEDLKCSWEEIGEVFVIKNSHKKVLKLHVNKWVIQLEIIFKETHALNIMIKIIVVKIVTL